MSCWLHLLLIPFLEVVLYHSQFQLAIFPHCAHLNTGCLPPQSSRAVYPQKCLSLRNKIKKEKKILFSFNVLKKGLTITTYYLSIGYIFCGATMHDSDIRGRRLAVPSVLLQSNSLSSMACGQHSSFHISFKPMSCTMINVKYLSF